jgi:hypothetical protein
MISHDARSVIQTRLHVSAGKPGIFFQHILDGIAGSKELQNGLRRNTRATNDWTPIANIRTDGNAIRHVFTLSQFGGFENHFQISKISRWRSRDRHPAC